jgi:hypothetical protein
MNRIVGKGWAFPPRVGDRDRIEMAEDDADIRQAIRIIIGTALGERVMRPDFGCRIHELIFDPCNDETATRAVRYVREALRRWEPRINLDEVTAVPIDARTGELIIEIKYTIKGRPDARALVFPFYLIPSPQ